MLGGVTTSEQDAAYAILDEGLVAHVGFVVDNQPFVVPMAYGRDGDRLLLHASVASRFARTLANGAPVCVTVTLLDGLVIARSQFHHSMNYRSVMVVGEARRIADPTEAEAALVTLVDHIIPGRSSEARPGNRVEHRRTAVLAVPLDSASLKVRSGGPTDEPEDIATGGWAGVIPLQIGVGAPVPDDLSTDLGIPPSIAGFRRP
ncbi:MAG: pyridoxamine 5'-phosphate oxidase family protein [Microthrixaceae bacterium]|nr:pyridoxamine 5'-phosphate oxidase family protein [Microthrixaceae bacterium]